jgi:hypothetical protein
MGHQFVPLADLLDRQVEQGLGMGAGLAQKPEAVTMRQQHHGARRKLNVFPVDFGDATARRDDHEDHRFHQPGHDEPPGRRHCGAAIERPGEPQHVQHLPERIGQRCGFKTIIHVKKLDQFFQSVQSFGRTASIFRQSIIDRPAPPSDIGNIVNRRKK